LIHYLGPSQSAEALRQQGARPKEYFRYFERLATPLARMDRRSGDAER
jgi:hypothetical protein